MSSLPFRGLALIAWAALLAVLLAGCRERRAASKTPSTPGLSESEVVGVLESAARKDALEERLHAEFSGRGLGFSVGFSSSSGSDDPVSTLLAGPSNLTVTGIETLEQGVEFNRELMKFLEGDGTELEVRYDIPDESMPGVRLGWSAAAMAARLAADAEWEKRQQGAAE